MFADGSQWEFSTGQATCDTCGEAPAAVHLVKINAGEIIHRHLCPTCAEQLAEETESAAVILASPAGLGNFFGRLADQGLQVLRQEQEVDQVCPVCGTTLADLRETGLAGCPACFEAHAADIEQSLYGGREPVGHEGKVPRRAPDGLLHRRELLRLERMLGELVRDERFEEAAGVRDRLSELTEQMGEGR